MRQAQSPIAGPIFAHGKRHKQAFEQAPETFSTRWGLFSARVDERPGGEAGCLSFYVRYLRVGRGRRQLGGKDGAGPGADSKVKAPPSSSTPSRIPTSLVAPVPSIAHLDAQLARNQPDGRGVRPCVEATSPLEELPIGCN